jgi:hypothetical protein
MLHQVGTSHRVGCSGTIPYEMRNRAQNRAHFSGETHT